MFFILSKVLGFVAVPSNLVMMLGLVGAGLLSTRFSRLGWRLVIGSLLLLAVFGFSPLGNALMVSLEQRFPRWDPARGAPDGMVVLGGVVTPDVSAARNEAALNESAERLTAVAELARRYPRARIVFSGGSGSLLYRDETEAEFAVRLLESFGIARERIATENQSRNTVENAEFSRRLAAPKAGERWLLVTSAYHVPRAVGVFRRIGFPVEAHPVDWRTRGSEDALRPFASVGQGLQRTDTAVREWIGLVIYRWMDQTAELFPGPGDPGCDRAGTEACRR